MRENIGLFRGKRIDTGNWVEGWLVIKKDPILDVTYCFILSYGKGESYVTWYTVDPDTVGECTGLNDKNGKLIFERHTINCGGTLYEVRMECGEWRMFDKAGYYCELYIYAEESEIVSENG